MAEAEAETALCSAQLQDIDFVPGLPVVGLHVKWPLSCRSVASECATGQHTTHYTTVN